MCASRVTRHTSNISSCQKKKTFSVFLWLWTIPLRQALWFLVINVCNHGEHYETPCIFRCQKVQWNHTTSRPLKTRQSGSYETSFTNHSVTRRCVSHKRRSQLHRWKKRTVKASCCLGTKFNEPSNFWDKSLQSSMVYTDMRLLTTGIRSEKCVVRRFRHCANMYFHKPR